MIATLERVWLLILALSVHPLALSAGTDQPAGSVWVGLTSLDFDYEEFDDLGNSLDREQGLLPGVTGGFTYETQAWLFGGNLRSASGNVDYTSPAADSTTDETLLDLALFAGLPLLSTQSDRLQLIAGGGYHSWRRVIHSTSRASGLDETYRWRYALLGLRGEHRLDARTHLDAEIHLNRILKPEISVHFLCDCYDDVDLDLGEENGFRISAGLMRQLGNGFTLHVSPWYEYWKLGRSAESDLYRNGLPVGHVHEPRSETLNIGIDLNLRWRFNLN